MTLQVFSAAHFMLTDGDFILKRYVLVSQFHYNEYTYVPSKQNIITLRFYCSNDSTKGMGLKMFQLH